MPEYPTAPSTLNIELKPCCVQALENIRNIQDIGATMLGLTGASIIVKLLAREPEQTANKIVKEDWDVLARGISGLATIVATEAWKAAFIHNESQRHPGDLGTFWKSLAAFLDAGAKGARR